MADFHRQREGERRDAFAAALAEALGKPADEVEAALEEVRPGDRPRRPCGGPPPLRGLTGALDVTRAELHRALRELPAVDRSVWEDHRDDLVAFLAERFGLSEDRGRHHGPGRP
jgi:hypothetical protein